MPEFRLPPPSTRQTADVAESAAISASLLCLVHCLALPLLLMLLPGALGLFAQSELFHIAALALVVPAAGIAFGLGYRRHRTFLPPLLGLCGVGCLAVALLFPAGLLGETLLTVTGSLLLTVGHVANWRLRRCSA